MRGALIARNSIWVALDTVSDVVCGLVISVAVARVMGPTKLGRYAQIVWFINMTGLLAAYGVSGAVRKYGAEFVGRGDLGTAKSVVQAAYHWQIQTAAVLVSLGVGLVFLLLPSESRFFATLLVLSLFPYLLLGVSAGALDSVQDFGANVLPSMISNVVNLMGTVLALMLGWDLVGVAGAMLAARTLDSALRYQAYRRSSLAAASGDAGHGPGLPDELRHRLRRFIIQTSTLVAINLVVWDRSEIFFLGYFRDIKEVAFFSLGFNIVYQVLLLPRSFATAAGANMMAEQGRDPAGVGRIARAVTRYLAVIAFPLLLGVAALSGPAVAILYGQSYAPAIPVLAITALFGLTRAIVYPAHQVLLATERQGLLLRWGVVTAVLTLGLDLLWIPRGGVVGAAWANGASQAVAVLGMWIFAMRSGVRPDFGALFKTLVAAAVPAVVAAVIARLMPPIPAVVLAVVLGVPLYLASLRGLRVIQEEDGPRLQRLVAQLPGPLQGPFGLVVRNVIP